MNAIKYRVSLDMFDTLSQTTIKAKKCDSACQIHITLTEHGKIYNISEGCYATFNAKKLDGNFVYDHCTIEGNTIVYDFASSVDKDGVCQVSAREGIVECEVTLYNANFEQLTSPRFTLFIDGTVYNGEEIVSSSEANALKKLINEGHELIEEMEEKLETAQVTQTVSGETVEVTDMSATKHNVEVTLSSDSVTDFSAVEVIKSGKNLFNVGDWANDGGDGAVSAVIDKTNGTIEFENKTKATRTITWDFFVPIGSTVTCNYPNNTSGKGISFGIYINGSYKFQTAIQVGNKATYNIGSQGLKAETNKVRLKAYIPGNEYYNEKCTLEKIQVELGTVATDYAPYEGEVHTADADGTVAPFTSLYPYMMFYTSTEGVNLDVSYKKDGTIEDLMNTVIAENNKELKEELIPKSKVKGCKMAIIGDSISYGVSSIVYPEIGKVVTAASSTSLLTGTNEAWWQLVKDRYGIAEVRNNSRSGASFSKDGSQNNPRFTTYLNSTDLPEDLDIIMVFGGTNDWGVNTSLGTMSDAASIDNDATFYASVKAVLEYLTLNFAKKQIVFVLPLQRYFQTWHYDDEGNRVYDNFDTDNDDGKSMFFNCRNGKGLYLHDYVNVLRELCADYGVEVCDLYAHSQMYMNNEAFKLEYAPDGLHPNADGTKRYVKNGIFPTLDKLWLSVEETDYEPYY